MRDIKEAFDLDLLAPFADPKEAENVFGNIASDVGRIIDIAYFVCKDQIESLELSDRDFGERFDQESINNVTQALMEEYVNFFQPQVKKALQQLISRIMDEAKKGPKQEEIESEINELVELEFLKMKKLQQDERTLRKAELAQLRLELNSNGTAEQTSTDSEKKPQILTPIEQPYPDPPTQPTLTSLDKASLKKMNLETTTTDQPNP